MDSLADSVAESLMNTLRELDQAYEGRLIRVYEAVIIIIWNSMSAETPLY